MSDLPTILVSGLYRHYQLAGDAYHEASRYLDAAKATHDACLAEVAKHGGKSYTPHPQGGIRAIGFKSLPNRRWVNIGGHFYRPRMDARGVALAESWQKAPFLPPSVEPLLKLYRAAFFDGRRVGLTSEVDESDSLTFFKPAVWAANGVLILSVPVGDKAKARSSPAFVLLKRWEVVRLHDATA